MADPIFEALGLPQKNANHCPNAGASMGFVPPCLSTAPGHSPHWCAPPPPPPPAFGTPLPAPGLTNANGGSLILPDVLPAANKPPQTLAGGIAQDDPAPVVSVVGTKRQVPFNMWEAQQAQQAQQAGTGNPWGMSPQQMWQAAMWYQAAAQVAAASHAAVAASSQAMATQHVSTSLSPERQIPAQSDRVPGVEPPPSLRADAPSFVPSAPAQWALARTKMTFGGEEAAHDETARFDALVEKLTRECRDVARSLSSPGTATPSAAAATAPVFATQTPPRGSKTTPLPHTPEAKAASAYLLGLLKAASPEKELAGASAVKDGAARRRRAAGDGPADKDAEQRRKAAEDIMNQLQKPSHADESPSAAQWRHKDPAGPRAWRAKASSRGQYQ